MFCPTVTVLSDQRPSQHQHSFFHKTVPLSFFFLFYFRHWTSCGIFPASPSFLQPPHSLTNVCPASLRVSPRRALSLSPPLFFPRFLSSWGFWKEGGGREGAWRRREEQMNREGERDEEGSEGRRRRWHRWQTAPSSTGSCRRRCAGTSIHVLFLSFSVLVFHFFIFFFPCLLLLSLLLFAPLASTPPLLLLRSSSWDLQGRESARHGVETGLGGGDSLQQVSN